MKSLRGIFPGLLLDLKGHNVGCIEEPGFNAWILQTKNGWQVAIMHFTEDSVSE